jgi:hypothetical protein
MHTCESASFASLPAIAEKSAIGRPKAEDICTWACLQDWRKRLGYVPAADAKAREAELLDLHRELDIARGVIRSLEIQVREQKRSRETALASRDAMIAVLRRRLAETSELAEVMR